jgi:hypothetical protein
MIISIFKPVFSLIDPRLQKFCKTFVRVSYTGIENINFTLFPGRARILEYTYTLHVKDMYVNNIEKK